MLVHRYSQPLPDVHNHFPGATLQRLAPTGYMHISQIVPENNRTNDSITKHNRT
jgi:hypothetical protein